MKVILVQPKNRISRSPKSKEDHFSIPLGLVTVASSVEKAGYQVKIIDQRSEKGWEQVLLADLNTDTVCVGITVMTGPQIWWALKISEFVKKHSDVPIIWGGVHCSLLPEQTLQNPLIDILVIEEGEETFPELVNAIRDKEPLENIKGIWFKEGKKIKQTSPRPCIDLNNQPLINYKLIDIKRYSSIVAGQNCLPFETSRGCPFSCTFCYNTCFHRKTWRGYGAEETLFRIEHAIKTTGLKGLSFYDDNLFLKPDRVYQILEGMIKKNMNLVWGKGDIRLDLLAQLDDDFLSLIQKSGCVNLVIGVESGSQRIADALRKDIDVAQVVPLNKKLAKYNIHLQYLFVVGTPGETIDDIAKTGALMRKLVNENPRATTGLQIFVPYPGTELFQTAIQQGHIIPEKLEDWVTYTWMNRRLTYPWLTPEKRKAIQMLAFCSIFLARERNLGAFTPVNPFVANVARLYAPIAQYRVKGMHYGLLPELKVAEILGYKGY
jgi:anaerobic magnesium-protoporphyrin IX monomethyl ester cyclase